MESVNSDHSKVIAYIEEVFGEDAEQAKRIAYLESGYRCDAIGDRNLNPSSYGVFQIRAFSSRPPISELLDCKRNIEIAHDLFHEQGWKIWTTFRKL